MLYNKKSVVCGLLVIVFCHALGMDTVIQKSSEQESAGQRQGDESLKVVNKRIVYKLSRTKCRRKRPALVLVPGYAAFALEDESKNLLKQSEMLQAISGRLILEVSDYDACQISGVDELRLDEEIAECMQKIDAHIHLCKRLEVIQGIPRQTRLYILNTIRKYDIARQLLESDYGYICKLIHESQTEQARSESDDETW